MNCEGKQRQQNNLDWLLATLFKMAFPVWEDHKGDVPNPELQELDELGDWPCGLAGELMKRISRDEHLRKQLHIVLDRQRIKNATHE